MYHIVLCDDEPSGLEQMTALLQAYGELRPEFTYSARTFSAAQILAAQRAWRADCDVLLLDVCVLGKSGVDAVRELRADGFRVPIIFLSNSPDYALDAFSVDALQYLIKPVDRTVFFAALDRALERIEQERRRYLVVKVSGDVRRVALRDLIYTESQRNYQCLHLARGEMWSIRMTLAELAAELAHYPEFVRCGVPYFINLNHVSGLSAKALHLDSGEQLWLPRGTYTAMKDHYFDFYCGGRASEEDGAPPR